MKIQVLSVNVNHIPNAKGGYDVAEVAYKDVGQNKIGGKKIMSFTDKPLFAAVKELKPNEFYEVTIAKEANPKDGKEYWNWKAVVPSDASAPAPVAGGKGGNAAPKSNYETPEERAIKQRLIVRQSSLSVATTMLKTDKNQPSLDDVLSLAERLADWVYASASPVATANEFEDDIPF